MRKWMRERLQRRKKKPAEPSDQPAPPPLQPAYFDAGPPSDAESNSPDSAELSAMPAASEVPSPRRNARVEEPRLETPSEEPAPPAQSTSRNAGQATRGRRRRGGRGRGGRGREQAVAQAFTPAAVKGSIPLAPVQPVVEEMPEADPDAEVAQTPEPVAVAVPKPPVPAAVAQRPPKGVVVLAIGLPGSGKSSWFKRH